MSLCIAALVICSGRESLIVHAHLYWRVHATYINARRTSLARSVFCALLLYCTRQHLLCSCRPDSVRWANTSAEQVEENESAFDEQTATQAASGRAGDVQEPLVMRLRFEPTAVRWPHCTHSLGGDAGQPPLRPVLVALTRPAALAPLMCNLSPYYTICISYSYSHSSYLPTLTAISHWVLNV